MSARANVVLPAPRSPESVTRSPGSSDAGDVDRQPAGGVLVRQHHREACERGRGCESGVRSWRQYAHARQIRSRVTCRGCRHAARPLGSAAGRRRSRWCRGRPRNRASPCRRAARRTSAPARGRGRCRGGASRARWVSNQSNTLSCTSAGMPGPRSVTENTTASCAAGRQSVTVSPRGEKPTALASRIEQRLAHAPLVGDEAADVGRGADVEHDARS